MIFGPVQYLNCEFLSRDLSKCYGAPIVMSLPYFMEAPDFLRYLYYYSYMQKNIFCLDYKADFGVEVYNEYLIMMMENGKNTGETLS